MAVEDGDVDTAFLQEPCRCQPDHAGADDRDMAWVLPLGLELDTSRCAPLVREVLQRTEPGRWLVLGRSACHRLSRPAFLCSRCPRSHQRPPASAATTSALAGSRSSSRTKSSVSRTIVAS